MPTPLPIAGGMHAFGACAHLGGVDVRLDERATELRRIRDDLKDAATPEEVLEDANEPPCEARILPRRPESVKFFCFLGAERGSCERKTMIRNDLKIPGQVSACFNTRRPLRRGFNGRIAMMSSWSAAHSEDPRGMQVEEAAAGICRSRG